MISAGFPFDFYFDLILILIWLDFGWIWLDFDWILVGFGLIRVLIALTALQEVLGSSR